MNAKDVMTSPVITVTPDTLVSDIAALLLEKRISAVPVLHKDRLAGIVSDADLLRRYEIGTDRTLKGDPWWLRLLGTSRLPGEYVKSHARYARDVMTRGVAAVAPDTSLADIATMLENLRIRRVPVLHEERLVGFVSRSDLVRALAAAKTARQFTDAMSDEEIRGQLVAELRRQAWWRPEYSNVSVDKGVVTYGGYVDLEDERAAARVAAEIIPGVVDVVDARLSYQSLNSMM